MTISWDLSVCSLYVLSLPVWAQSELSMHFRPTGDSKLMGCKMRNCDTASGSQEWQRCM